MTGSSVQNHTAFRKTTCDDLKVLLASYYQQEVYDKPVSAVLLSEVVDESLGRSWEQTR